MRLSCDCSVSARHGASVSSGRVQRSSLAVGARDGVHFLMLSTAADRAGRKYELSRANFERAFTR